MVQPKQLKLIIEVSGMRVELMMREVLLENSEFLENIWELFAKQLKEIRGLQWAVSAI